MYKFSKPFLDVLNTFPKENYLKKIYVFFLC